MTGRPKGLSHALFSAGKNVTAGSHGAANEHWLSSELRRCTNQTCQSLGKHELFTPEIEISSCIGSIVGEI